MPHPPRKRRSGCLTALIVVLVISVCLCIAGSIAVFALDFSIPFLPLDTPTAAPGADAPVTVVNNLDEPICYLLSSPSGIEDWGDDWLGEEEVIAPGGTLTVWVPSNQMIDMSVYDCEQNLLDQQLGVQLTDDGLTYTLDPLP